MQILIQEIEHYKLNAAIPNKILLSRKFICNPSHEANSVFETGFQMIPCLKFRLRVDLADAHIYIRTFSCHDKYNVMQENTLK